MAALKLPCRLYESLLAETRRSLPNECCGLLGGHGRDITHIFPATNQLASPVAYEIPPRELCEIFRRMRAEKIKLVGIYHSHPAGDTWPSARDRERAYYAVAYVIVSPHQAAADPVRAFWLQAGAVRELEVQVVG
ncbi:MAG: M67 family metallopeptidase [Terriglobia bacterium]